MFITPFSSETTSPTPLRARALEFQNFEVTFPHEKIIQVTINRPQKLNCIDKRTSQEIAEIWELFDEDETLLVGIITGVGRAFCTGADLQGMHKIPVGYVGMTRYRQTRLTRHGVLRMERDEQEWCRQRYGSTRPSGPTATGRKEANHRRCEWNLHGWRF